MKERLAFFGEEEQLYVQGLRGENEEADHGRKGKVREN